MVKYQKIKKVWLLLLLFLGAAAYFYRSLPSEILAPNKISTQATQLNRNPAQLAYSKHARCRMDCRDINQSEVKSLLKSGIINFQKSDLSAANICKRRYAVEGKSNDGQHIRLIVASCATTTTVITVIDLEKEWTCTCP